MLSNYLKILPPDESRNKDFKTPTKGKTVKT